MAPWPLGRADCGRGIKKQSRPADYSAQHVVPKREEISESSYATHSKDVGIQLPNFPGSCA